MSGADISNPSGCDRVNILLNAYTYHYALLVGWRSGRINKPSDLPVCWLEAMHGVIILAATVKSSLSSLFTRGNFFDTGKIPRSSGPTVKKCTILLTYLSTASRTRHICTHHLDYRNLDSELEWVVRGHSSHVNRHHPRDIAGGTTPVTGVQGISCQRVLGSRFVVTDQL